MADEEGNMEEPMEAAAEQALEQPEQQIPVELTEEQKQTFVAAMSLFQTFVAAMSLFWEQKDETQLIEFFQLLNPNGEDVSRELLKTAMECLPDDLLSQDKVDEVLEESDLNKDQKINRAKFLSAMKIRRTDFILKEAEKNKKCDLCTSAKAMLLCRCTFPPTFLCPNCLGTHYMQAQQAKHEPGPIYLSDLQDLEDELKLGLQNDEIKDNKRNMLIHSQQVIAGIDIYAVNRCNEIDEIMVRFQDQSTELKNRIIRQKDDEKEKVREFVSQFMQGHDFDYLFKDYRHSECVQILPVEFMEKNLYQKNIDMIFELRNEIHALPPPKVTERLQIPPAEQETQYFEFSEDNWVVKFLNVQEQGYSSIKSTLHSFQGRTISIKFKMSHQDTYFGICNANFEKGMPGYTNDGWSWRVDGGNAGHGNTSFDYNPVHQLGDLTNKTIELTYNGIAKTLFISCENKARTLEDPRNEWPEDAYFVFSLSSNDQILTLLH